MIINLAVLKKIPTKFQKTINIIIDKLFAKRCSGTKAEKKSAIWVRHSNPIEKIVIL